MTSMEDRVSRMEGAYEHLATKADTARVEGAIAELRGELRASMRAMYWIMAAIGVELAVLTLILKLVD